MAASTLRRCILQSTLAALLTATATHAEPARPAESAGDQQKSNLGAALGSPAATPQSQQEPNEAARMAASAHGLLRDYLAKRYSAVGERLEIALELGAPEPVQGWPGRWRFSGTVALRHYYDSEADGPTRKRVLEIRETRELSASRKVQLIEHTTFIRSETITFEACVTGTGAAATIDFTLR